MALIQICDNPECELPTGLVPIEVEPNTFFCIRCFRRSIQETNAAEFQASPHQVSVRKNRGPNYFHVQRQRA